MAVSDQPSRTTASRRPARSAALASKGRARAWMRILGSWLRALRTVRFSGLRWRTPRRMAAMAARTASTVPTGQRCTGAPVAATGLGEFSGSAPRRRI